ncbi:MAG: PorV/PorQ family protein [Bacteroidetes bacterium]|nr:PorV/PorQ family protein [Bacteroidota bacterium]
MKNINIYKIKTIILSLFLLIITIHCAAADETSPYNFLRNSSNARITGLSGTVTALEDDPGALFFNPALISTVNNRNCNVTFLKHILDINSGNISYIHHFDNPKLGTIAAAAVFTNYGTFDYINEQGVSNGNTFTGNLLSLQASYSNIIDNNLYYGISAKLIYNSLESMSGFAGAVDAGLFYKFSDNRTNLGVSILNAGSEIKKMTNNAYTMPLDIRLGGSHRLEGLPLLFNLGFNHLNEPTSNFFSRFKNFSIGGEIYFGNIVQARIGFDNYIRNNVASSDNKGLSGFSFGAGIVNPDWFLDINYGMSVYTDNILIHRFSINFNL